MGIEAPARMVEVCLTSLSNIYNFLDECSHINLLAYIVIDVCDGAAIDDPLHAPIAFLQIQDGQSSGHLEDNQPRPEAHQIEQVAIGESSRPSQGIEMPRTKHRLHDPVF